MNQDREQELERLEKELLPQEAEPISDEELLMDIRQFFLDEEQAAAEAKAAEESVEDQELAFDDPQFIHEPDEPMIYRNFSNNYGEKTQAEIKKEKKDRVDIGLMIAASALSLGIIGVLIYWLVAYL